MTNYRISNYNVLRPRKVLSQKIKTMGAGEMEQFLTTFTADETRQSKTLWETYASHKPMAHFLGSKYLLDNLQYFSRVKHASGKIFVRRIPYTIVKNDVIRYSRGVRGELRAITKSFVDGNLGGQEWYDQSAQLLKVSHRAAFTVEEGGYDDFQTNYRLERWLTAMVIILALFNRTADELNSYEREVNGRLLLTADVLADDIPVAFENWRLATALGNGLKECRRVLGPAEHCTSYGDRLGCVELAQRSWMLIWKMIPIGRAACYAKCHCILEYR